MVVVAVDAGVGSPVRLDVDVEFDARLVPNAVVSDEVDAKVEPTAEACARVVLLVNSSVVVVGVSVVGAVVSAVVGARVEARPPRVPPPQLQQCVSAPSSELRHLLAESYQLQVLS